ncbi:MAG: hypothetical protein IJX25_03825 [Clostridia bacterium]|nr:hypothetical protein [Clostridia bacterium]MBQ8792723.1 hypothetical protein [Clostridia bacterium]
MKRMIAFVFVIVLLISLVSIDNDSELKFSMAESGVLVTSKALEDKECFCSGNEYYSSFEGDELINLLEDINQYENVKGVNLYFSNDVPLNYFQSQIDYLESETIENVGLLLGYCKDYNDFVWTEGKKINVQLAKIENGWVLGFPMILTGF